MRAARATGLIDNPSLSTMPPANITRGHQSLGWWWKWNSHTGSKDYGLVLICDAGMHDRAVPVPLNVHGVALVGITPAGLESGLLATHSPCEVVEMLFRRLRKRGRSEIDESIAKGQHGLEVRWHVEEVITAIETLLIEKFAEVRSRGSWQHIPEQHRGSPFLGLLCVPQGNLLCLDLEGSRLEDTRWA